MGTLFPFGAAQAETSSQLVTCINLTTKSERISHTGKCRISQEAQAYWHELKSDSRLPEKEKSKSLLVCSNKPTSPVSYQIIRKRCASHQIRTEYYRSSLLVQAPTIIKVVATGHDTAQVSLAKDPSANLDAPVAYYTITSSKGQSKNVYSWGELNLTIDNLSELTTYSFTVTATTADGTSNVSMPSDSVTTDKYVAPPAPASKTVAVPVAQVNLISSDTASVTIPAGATSVAIPAPALGNPSLTFGSQGTSISATITSASNPAGSGSTPFMVSGSTKIVDISVTGLSGSATVCLDASPTAQLWHYVGGVWLDITSSRTSTQVCGSTSSFSPFTSAERTLTCAEGGDCALGDTGPGGGLIFYVSASGFNCGASYSSTGSPTGGLCHYLEVAKKTWYGGTADPVLQYSTYSAIPDASLTAMISAGLENGWELTASGGSTVITDLGRGFKNTTILLAAEPAKYPAAYAARNDAGNGLTDWYLPNGKEIYQLCKWNAGKAWVSDATPCSPGSVGSNPNKAEMQMGFDDTNPTIKNTTLNGQYHVSYLAWVSAPYQVAMATGTNGTGPNMTRMSYTRPIRAF
jgi:hypothetical protein